MLVSQDTGIFLMRYIQGENRSQSALFPLSLDELIPDDHLVRVIEAYIALLDFEHLGFDKARPKATGRPSYDPADLLKLYLYGYFQRIRSSRRLEAECRRNVEVMWLLGRLAPDFKTIADFRRDNSAAFTATCRAFVRFCRQAGLIAGELVAIDGSKFQAVASSRKHLTTKKLEHREAALDKKIARYLAQLDEADRDEEGESIDRSAVQKALAELQVKKANNQTCQVLMQAQGLTQHVVGESDAQKMRTASVPLVAYNVQSVVDAKHCLILHHEVTQEGTDNRQLEPMAKAAKDELQQTKLCVTADAGYSNGAQFQACEDAAITAFVPPNRANNPTSGEEQYFDRTDFSYDKDTDQYQCPAGKPLTLKQLNKGDRIYQAAISDCGKCPLKSRCTKAQRRYLMRHAHEAAFERMEQRMKAHPEMMVNRRSIVEHPFGNLKHWIFGNGRFLLRQLKGTRAEMALAVQAYNLKRAIQVLGAQKLIALMG
ncbi:Transposase [Pseudomonas frederiksbergensis]|uniref:Transposase n=2 Tax=Pseudomonas frederiksbergensis TaxID=104087 RepID=A0A1H5G179_9PSED|nr:Transposase [Pseudomonas frederiksbergensis]SEE09443.1 Transposase [Pseudomonas frederiksbergensis]